MPFLIQNVVRANSAYAKHRDAAVQMNDLAGNLRSFGDARHFIDLLAGTFAEQIPWRWTFCGLREHVARVEYGSAGSPDRLIPEARVAAAWNAYARRIEAYEIAPVTEDEVHNLRDAHHTTSKALWGRGQRSVWSMPNVYAVGSDGKVSKQGCRAVEALRTVWDFANMFQNLEAARERVRARELVSDWMGDTQGVAQGTSQCQVQAEVCAPDPMQLAHREYLRQHGKRSLQNLVRLLIYDLLPQSSAA